LSWTKKANLKIFAVWSERLVMERNAEEALPEEEFKEILENAKTGE
jgi:hypothetical protein